MLDAPVVVLSNVRDKGTTGWLLRPREVSSIPNRSYLGLPTAKVLQNLAVQNFCTVGEPRHDPCFDREITHTSFKTFGSKTRATQVLGIIRYIYPRAPGRPPFQIGAQVSCVSREHHGW